VARKRLVYVCGECGASQPKWSGRCPECGAWNTLTEMAVEPAAARNGGTSSWRAGGPRGGPVPLADVSMAAVDRIDLPLGEWNRVLGGGVVPGSLVLIGGEPGIGKSTLILQVSALLAQRGGPVLYVSGEESNQQVKLRAERMGIVGAGLFLQAETNLDEVLNAVAELNPRALVVDSIQAVYLDDVPSAAGTVSQVRECTARLMRVAKGDAHMPVFLVGHVTKAGDLAGPRVLEHMVDIVLYLEGDRYHSYRVLRSVKNRFGSTNEIGVFEMASHGLVEVSNPSEAFLAERLSGVPGSAVTVTMEGSRPLLVEIQALVSPTGLPVPRRTANGFDVNRLILLTAVLGKRLGVALGGQDIFVNVVGGLRLSEPAVDLAVALAIVSSARGLALADDLAIVGEIGLSGELRSVGHVERRLAEAAKLGFKRAVVPAASLRRLPKVPGLDVIGARTVGQAWDVAVTNDPTGQGPGDPEAA
jgi:DNA repair protein RadA/Sms